MSRDTPRRRLRSNWAQPAPDRFDPASPGFARAMAAHDRAAARGEGGYLDPGSGLFVMTAESLAARPCCDQGCRHCPWDRGPLESEV